MFRNRWLVVCIACVFMSIGAIAQDTVDEKSGEMLHIDIPTKLEKANVVIDMGHLVFGGICRLHSGTYISSQRTFATGIQKVKLWLFFTETRPTLY